MSLEDFLIKVVAPTIALILILLDRWDKIKKADSNEKLNIRALANENLRLIQQIHQQYQSQIAGLQSHIEYLKEQLDDCLDDSRKEPPWNKS